MKIAAIAKVIKDRGSCRLYRVHGSDDLETKFYIGTNLKFTRWKGSLSRGAKQKLWRCSGSRKRNGKM